MKRGSCQASWVLLLLGVFLIGIMVFVSVFRTDLERFTQGKTGAAGNDAPPIPFDSPEQSMFILGNNTCSPSCCPSTYSCSGGCVCLTNTQKELLAGRHYYSPEEGPSPASAPSDSRKHASVLVPDNTANAIRAAANVPGMIKLQSPSFSV